MYLADCHAHSRISPDGRWSMTQMAQAAFQAGLDELCFTDHVEPIAWGTTLPRGPYDWQALEQEFIQARQAWGDRLQLRLGIELGDAPWDFRHTERLLSGAPELDFIIGSVHMLSPEYGGKDLFFFHPGSEAEARAGIADYLRQVRKLAEWGAFSVLGHLTLPLRYFNENRGFHLTFDGFEREVEEIFGLLLEHGCGIELNTNRGNAPLPGEKWLRMYHRMGGRIVTLGADAHSPDFVGRSIREGQALLKRCGFDAFCTFRRREPVWHPL